MKVAISISISNTFPIAFSFSYLSTELYTHLDIELYLLLRY